MKQPFAMSVSPHALLSPQRGEWDAVSLREFSCDGHGELPLHTMKQPFAMSVSPHALLSPQRGEWDAVSLREFYFHDICHILFHYFRSTHDYN